jgi:hypothetical protein
VKNVNETLPVLNYTMRIAEYNIVWNLRPIMDAFKLPLAFPDHGNLALSAQKRHPGQPCGRRGGTSFDKPPAGQHPQGQAKMPRTIFAGITPVSF